MDTRWGLDLDMSAVRLMRRTGDDWIEERVEKIDSPDIEQRLETLVAPIVDDGPVMVFLPRDQILYTRVDLDASEDPRPQIEKAMDGRTPYGLDELSIDWDEVAPNSVQVAAIARDTLDEAAAFAEVRNLKIAGYSTLFSGDDFPRLPKFEGPDLVDEAAEPEPPVTFATARVPSRPPDAAVAAAAAAASAKARFTPTPTAAEVAKADVAKPVLRVDDATPVVQVKPPQAPLDPGLPISAPNAPPRIRTDIAASTVSGRAASLTPPGGSVKMRKSRAPVSTLAVFAVALLLTVGVAVLVWNYLPMRPSATADAPVDTGALPEAVVEDAAPGPAPEEPSPSIIAEDAAPDPVVDEQAPSIVAEDAVPDEVAPPVEQAFTTLDAATTAPISDLALAAPTLPEAELAATLPAVIQASPGRTDSTLIAAAPAIAALPQADRTTPELQLPRMTASLQTTSPFLGPDPDTDETADDVYVSAFEIPEPATDAIALPDPRRLTSGPLPDTGGADVAALEPAEIADPVASAVEQALADALAGPGGLIPTDLARSVPDTAPRPRPDQFTEQIERQQFGGRTRTELAGLRPPARPESAQSLATVAETPPSELAVATSIQPRTRPSGMAALVAAARVQQEAARVTASAAIASPDTSGAIQAALEEEETEPQNRAVRPRILSIPTTANVARQATVENAIRLNRVNLVGVYGAPSDRRALVRLSSGRYVKVKVGDRVDGGTVRQITDSELYYSKGNRTLSLEVPQG
ncbi:MAG: hypothetical protein AAF281_13170 [Pseudomonadota bacterium]